MDYIHGTSRTQLQLFNECLDDAIDEKNPVLVIDAYVESLDLKELGFKMPALKPPYNPSVLLKIYVSGTVIKYSFLYNLFYQTYYCSNIESGN